MYVSCPLYLHNVHMLRNVPIQIPYKSLTTTELTTTTSTELTTILTCRRHGPCRLLQGCALKDSDQRVQIRTKRSTVPAALVAKAVELCMLYTVRYFSLT